MKKRETRDGWAEAKNKQLREGYATEWDRRTAAAIRQQQTNGVDVSEASICFAEKVEKIISQEN